MHGLIGIFLGVALWRAHMALPQRLPAKRDTDQAQPELRGSAFGLFYLASGVAVLFGSVVAVLWDREGPDVTFLTGPAFAAIALVLVARYGSQGQTATQFR